MCLSICWRNSISSSQYYCHWHGGEDWECKREKLTQTSGESHIYLVEFKNLLIVMKGCSNMQAPRKKIENSWNIVEYQLEDEHWVVTFLESEESRGFQMNQIWHQTQQIIQHFTSVHNLFIWGKWCKRKSLEWSWEMLMLVYRTRPCQMYSLCDPNFGKVCHSLIIYSSLAF